MRILLVAMLLAGAAQKRSIEHADGFCYTQRHCGITKVFDNNAFNEARL
jgi:hypothetical protein